MPPRDVDRHEFWELASILGLQDADEPAPQPTPLRGLTGRALYRARIEAAEKGLPPPVAAPPRG